MTLSWAVLAAAIATSLCGQVLLKSGAADATGFLAQLLRPSTMAGLALYGLSAMFYIVALRRIPVSVALPFTAVSYVAILLIGHFLFNEPLGLQKILAVALICAGVLVLATA